MTDDELRAWCATELLGWDFRPNSGLRYGMSDEPPMYYDMWWEKHPDPEMEGTDYAYEPRYLDRDLTGWLGFGHVVEAVQAKGYLVSTCTEPGHKTSVLIGKPNLEGTWGGVPLIDADPALAAIRAAYQVLK